MIIMIKTTATRVRKRRQGNVKSHLFSITNLIQLILIKKNWVTQGWQQKEGTLFGSLIDKR